MWSPEAWCQKFGQAWTGRYKRFYGDPGDPRGCANLGNLLERLPVAEVLEAQSNARQMFSAYLASEDRDVVAEKHPFVFFVTRFSRLRIVDSPGDGGKGPGSGKHWSDKYD